jgi:hypothetical protein
VVGTFLAICQEEQDLSVLREATHTALTSPLVAAGSGALATCGPPASGPAPALVPVTGLPSARWRKGDRRLFVTGPLREYRAVALRYALPVRSLCIMRP